MSVKVKRIDIFEVELPLKIPFKHAQRERQTSGSVFVKVQLDSGVTGYGEALPRKYVTGETTASVMERLRSVLGETLLGAEFSSLNDAKDFIETLDELQGAARCAAELAILDAVGKNFKESVSAILGGKSCGDVFYSGVISAGSVPSAAMSALKMKLFGFKQVKVKVGFDNDMERLQIIRNILGDAADIRVDANCAWSADEAIKSIGEMRTFGISAVEQPVKADDIEGLKKVTGSVPETVIVDESLCTIDDAKKLSLEKACNMFNIRISKCGGLINALKIAGIARAGNIRYQLGCQVGESGILSAAGRHFACGLDNIEYFEGSYGKFLLKEDITKENMTFTRGGRAEALNGPGLGVNVLDDVLEKYTVNRSIIER